MKKVSRKQEQNETITIPEDVTIDLGDREVILEKGDKVKVNERSKELNHLLGVVDDNEIDGFEVDGILGLRAVVPPGAEEDYASSWNYMIRDIVRVADERFDSIYVNYEAGKVQCNVGGFAVIFKVSGNEYKTYFTIHQTMGYRFLGSIENAVSAIGTNLQALDQDIRKYEG